jgi:riboflavin kinase/FMN adenylyltransferase
VGIFTGFNHHFGLNREGNCDFLKKYAKDFGYKFYALPSQEINGKLISSSAIRGFLEQGKIESANSMLGREFCVSGIVVDGSKIGRTINFPTANICYPDDIVQIPNGVYSVYAKLSDGRILNGISNFGTKPTVNNSSVKTLETHILDGFDEDIYGQKIKISFLKFVRTEQKFNGIEELKAQIKKDIEFLNN